MLLFVRSIVLVSVCLLFSTCSSNKKELPELLEGNWLVLYPDHKLTSFSQQEVYGKYQDSIVNLYGLKLLTFKKGGEFREMDSLYKTAGKWQMNGKNKVIIQEGGKGFNPFKVDYAGFKNDTLRLAQYFSLDDEKIKLVWHLKQITDDDATKLFSEESNSWRRRPTMQETDAQIKKRLSAVLNYYSQYYQLVSEESIYFLGLRVPLPLSYYQHAVGIMGYMPPSFVNLFFNEADATKAYAIIQQAMDTSAIKYETGENFVAEYAMFLKKLAQWVDKL